LGAALVNLGIAVCRGPGRICAKRRVWPVGVAGQTPPTPTAPGLETIRAGVGAAGTFGAGCGEHGAVVVFLLGGKHALTLSDGPGRNNAAFPVLAQSVMVAVGAVGASSTHSGTVYIGKLWKLAWAVARIPKQTGLTTNSLCGVAPVCAPPTPSISGA